MNSKHIYPIVVLCLVGLQALSCSDAVTSTSLSLSSPQALALVCQVEDGADWSPAPLDECDGESDSHRLMAFVTNGPSGDISIMNLSTARAIDTDPMVPGFTRLFVGGNLTDIVAVPGSTFVYALNSAPAQLVSLNTGDLTFHTFDLPFAGSTLFYDHASASLLVPWPGAGTLLRITLGEDGTPGETKAFFVEGSPVHIADGGMGRLLIGHATQQHITVLDRDTMSIITHVGIVPPCQDGLDNDDDGYIDGMDSGCVDPLDFSETEGATCADNPLDRYCAEAQPRACGNGEDDDGDGLVDLMDPGCLDRRDNTEDTDNQAGADTPPTLCSNGVDDDGDGLADFPDDPDCFSAGSASEKPVPAAMAHIAVSPDFRWAYVVHRGLGTLSVVNLETMSLVNVSDTDDAIHRQLRKRRDQWALLFTGEPLSLTFREENDEESTAIRAYVTDVIGQLSVVAVAIDGKPLHLIQEALEEDEDPDMTLAGKPRLYVDDEEIQMGFSPVMGHPNMGQLLVETVDDESGKKSYYGIEFREDFEQFRRAQLSETWHLEYEGALPGISSIEAQVAEPDRLVIGGINLCKFGALTGDYLVIEGAPGTDCDLYLDDVEVNFTISAVGRDWVELEPGSGWKTGLTGADPVDGLDPACFPEHAVISVRPVGQFVVRGSRTGYLHNVVDTPEGCEDVTTLLTATQEGLEPSGLFVGRVTPGEIITDQPLPVCPITAPLDGIAKPHHFQNAIFSLTIYPACTIDVNGQFFKTEPARDSRWSFVVGSGFTSKVILVASLPSDVALHEPTTTMYVLDLAGKSIREIDLEEFSLVNALF